MTRGLAAGLARAAALVVAGTGLGLGWNALRTDDRIELGRRYFAEVEPPTAADDTVAQVVGNGDVEAPPPPASRADGFVVVTTDEAVSLLDEAAEMPGFVLFVDARDAEHYDSGHLRGALNVDYYNAHRDLQATLTQIANASKLVIYCSSNECDDALMLCRELRDMYAIPPERILLYRDGMRDWEARGLSVERGS